MDNPVVRQPCDGQISVQRPGTGDIYISVTHNGIEQGLTMSDWNARRIFGSLSVILELPLAKSAAKKIQMGTKDS